MELSSTQPGFWQFGHHAVAGSYMHFNCPCGCRYGGCVRVVREGAPPPSMTHWTWNGDEQRPTLSPSLRRRTPCGFHGFLKNGVWEACADGAPLAQNVYVGVSP